MRRGLHNEQILVTANSRLSSFTVIHHPTTVLDVSAEAYLVTFPASTALVGIHNINIGNTSNIIDMSMIVIPIGILAIYSPNIIITVTTNTFTNVILVISVLQCCYYQYVTSSTPIHINIYKIYHLADALSRGHDHACT